MTRPILLDQDDDGATIDIAAAINHPFHPLAARMLPDGLPAGVIAAAFAGMVGAGVGIDKPSLHAMLDFAWDKAVSLGTGEAPAAPAQPEPSPRPAGKETTRVPGDVMGDAMSQILQSLLPLDPPGCLDALGNAMAFVLVNAYDPENREKVIDATPDQLRTILAANPAAVAASLDG